MPSILLFALISLWLYELIPCSIARKRLTEAFASTILLQKSNWIRLKITCHGYFEGQTLIIQYDDYGRGQLSFMLRGSLLDDPAGCRFQMKVSDDRLSLFYQILFPLVAVIGLVHLRIIDLNSLSVGEIVMDGLFLFLICRLGKWVSYY